MTEPPGTCANPDCNNPLPPRRRAPGRPALYCQASCRPSATPRTGPLTVEIGHPDTSPDGRPPQRVWTVELRRGQRSVTIADNLGWPTAAALADQLDTLINDRPRPRPHTHR